MGVDILISTVLGFIVGVIGGVVCGRKVNKMQIKNLDDVMLLISGAVTLLSIILSAFGVLEKVAVSIINIFGTMVFSWILTKKSAKKDFEEHEQELALKSYRHINYIESAANTAYKTIEESLNDVQDNETKLILSRAMDHIKYIQGGVNTCKLDWYDMLSEDDRNDLKSEKERSRQDFGELKVDLSDMQINQEDV